MTCIRDDEGAIAIVVAALSVVLFGLGAVVVDLGMARDARQNAQDSADAAVLAGAGAVSGPSVRSPRYNDALRAIRGTAATNYGVSSFRGCTAAVPSIAGVTWDNGARSRTTCIQFGSIDSEPATHVFVAMPERRFAPLLGGVLGSKGVEIAASAVAGRAVIGGSPCAVCVTDDLLIGGAGRLAVDGGGWVYAGDGVVADEPGVLTVFGGGISFTDEPDPSSGPAYTPDPPTVTGAAVTDPWDRTSMPAASRNRRTTTCDGSAPLLPGRYNRDVAVTGPCTLEPGVYRFTRTLTVAAGGSIDVDGVTLTFTGRGSLDVQGGELSLLGPAAGTTFSIYSSASEPLNLGSGISAIVGDVYSRSDAVTFGGGTTTVWGSLASESLTIEPGARLAVRSAGAGSQPATRGPLGLVK